MVVLVLVVVAGDAEGMKLEVEKFFGGFNRNGRCVLFGKPLNILTRLAGVEERGEGRV